MVSPDGFMETVICTIAVQVGLLVVGTLIIIMSKLMMDGFEILCVDLDAHFDTQIILFIQIPGRGMADDIPIPGFNEQGTLPERIRQFFETQGTEKCFTRLHHGDGIESLYLSGWH